MNRLSDVISSLDKTLRLQMASQGRDGQALSRRQSSIRSGSTPGTGEVERQTSGVKRKDKVRHTETVLVNISDISMGLINFIKFLLWLYKK